MPKNKGKPEKKAKAIDYAADENFKVNRTIIYIEHSDECPIFKTKALEFLTYLEEQFPDRIFALIRNKDPPRNGTFEISISQNARTPITQIWTGIANGPPRRDKFPNFQNLLSEINTILKKPYVDPNFKPAFMDDFEDLGDGGDTAEN